MSAPANLRPDHDIQWTTVNSVGGRWGARLKVSSVCNNSQQASHTLRAFCCSQCSTHVVILKIDNGETKTRINFDNRLFDYRLTSLIKANSGHVEFSPD